jgi:hypothetical protein
MKQSIMFALKQKINFDVISSRENDFSICDTKKAEFLFRKYHYKWSEKLI